MSTIELHQVCYAYDTNGQSFAALKNVNVTIRSGEFICILGRSGCGKTTLLRLIAGLQLPQQGSVCINGTPVSIPGTDRSVVFQNYALFPWMSALKNVQFGIRQAQKHLSRQESRERAEEYLRRVGMWEAKDKYPFQLSGGMCQRVAIARALAMDSEILLLDEPFGALDLHTRHELQVLIEKLWKDSAIPKTVIFVTHDISEAALLADRILYMTPGKIERDISVTLSRPRDVHSPQWKDLRHRLQALFYEAEAGGEQNETDW